MKYDFVEYNGGAPSRVMPERPSTLQELCVWMNRMAASVSSGVHHWITEKQIHFYIVDSSGNLGERGLL